MKRQEFEEMRNRMQILESIEKAQNNLERVGVALYSKRDTVLGTYYFNPLMDRISETVLKLVKSELHEYSSKLRQQLNLED